MNVYVSLICYDRKWNVALYQQELPIRRLKGSPLETAINLVEDYVGVDGGWIKPVLVHAERNGNRLILYYAGMVPEISNNMLDSEFLGGNNAKEVVRKALLENLP